MERTELKQEAIKRLKMLKVINNVISDFEQEDKLNVSEFGGILFWLDDEVVKKKISELEEKYGVVVYHVILSQTEFGTMYSFLYVSEEMEYWAEDREELEREGYTYAYVFNKTYPEFSEGGGIIVEPMNGGLRRTS